MYQIRYSDSALEDIKELRFVIRDTYKAPSTASPTYKDFTTK